MVSSNAFPMKYPIIPYRIFPLGDSALTIDFGNIIDEDVNKWVFASFHQLQQDPQHGIIELIPAYSSLTVCYDIVTVKKRVHSGKTVFESIKEWVEDKLHQPFSFEEIVPVEIKIPVCYAAEFAPDIEQLARTKGLTPQEVIEIHTWKSYKVYMLGFLPGFAYMGEVDERITMPRKQQPQNILPGSVGIAGKQTGIYPFASPGGWQIIGRTPLKLFDIKKEDPALLKAGQTVQFYSISKDEFENY